MFDSIVLADARIQVAKVLTGDRHFAGLPETLWVGAARRASKGE